MSRVRCSFFTVALFAGSSLPAADQWAKQAQQQAVYPSKIGIELPKISPVAGGSVELLLHLLNDRGEQIPAGDDIAVQVQMLSSTGKLVQSRNCAIPAKTTAGKCTLGAPSSGIFKLRATTPKNRELL